MSTADHLPAAADAEVAGDSIKATAATHYQFALDLDRADLLNELKLAAEDLARIAGQSDRHSGSLRQLLDRLNDLSQRAARLEGQTKMLNVFARKEEK